MSEDFKEIVKTRFDGSLNDVNELIDAISICHLIKTNGVANESMLIDRDTAFYYFSHFCNIGKEKSVSISRAINPDRTALLSSGDLSKIPCSIYTELRNVKYLFPRGHSTEIAYYVLIQALFCKEHKQDFLKLNQNGRIVI